MLLIWVWSQRDTGAKSSFSVPRPVIFGHGYPKRTFLQCFPSRRSRTLKWEDYFDLRWRVLRAPWQQPRRSEKDDQEAESQHLMIVGKSSRPLAIGRLHFNTPDEAQIRFMAVDPATLGSGLGSVILQECERRARAASGPDLDRSQCP